MEYLRWLRFLKMASQQSFIIPIKRSTAIQTKIAKQIDCIVNIINHYTTKVKRFIKNRKFTLITGDYIG